MVHNPYGEHYMKVYASKSTKALVDIYNEIIKEGYTWVRAIEINSIRQIFRNRHIDISAIGYSDFWAPKKIAFDNDENCIFIIE